MILCAFWPILGVTGVELYSEQTLLGVFRPDWVEQRDCKDVSMQGKRGNKSVYKSQ